MDRHRAIAELLVEFVADKPREMTRRDTPIPSMPAGVNKPLALLGVRRSGKTFLMHQVMADLAAAGVPRERMVWVNFEDERLDGFSAQDLGLLLDLNAELFPAAAEGERHLFLDEVQLVPGWERFVRRVVDGGGVRVWLTGSSSRLLRDEVSSALRGRSLAVEVSPFSFREYLRHCGIAAVARPGSREAARLRGRFRQYLACGGFPEVCLMEDSLRARVLQEYVSAAIHRDILERYEIRTPEILRALVQHLLQNVSCLFSVNRTYNLFRSQGRSVGKDTLYALLDHVRDAFLLFPVELWSESGNVRSVNPKKVYAVDPGLVSAYSWKYNRNVGALLENAVFCELRRRFEHVHYYRTGSGKEVDFLCTTRRGERYLVQVSAEIGDATTRQRELAASEEAMRELKLARAVLVALDHEESVRQAGRRIEIVPAWRWMLEG